MSHREPTADELEILETFQRGGGGFQLVPIRYRGEYRYAIGVVIESAGGSQLVKLLALCIEYEYDKDNFEVEEINNLDLN